MPVALGLGTSYLLVHGGKLIEPLLVWVCLLLPVAFFLLFSVLHIVLMVLLGGVSFFFVLRLFVVRVVIPGCSMVVRFVSVMTIVEFLLSRINNCEALVEILRFFLMIDITVMVVMAVIVLLFIDNFLSDNVFGYHLIFDLINLVHISCVDNGVVNGIFNGVVNGIDNCIVNGIINSNIHSFWHLFTRVS